MLKHAAALITLLVALPSVALAAEWPGNWLGPSDKGYRELKIGVFYYGAVLHDFADGDQPLQFDPAKELTALGSLPELSAEARAAELLRVQAEVQRGGEFYWRNTRFNCAFDFEWFIEGEPMLRSSIAGSEAPYFSPVDQPAYADKRSEYDGLLQIMVLYEWDSETAALRRVTGGGGFTTGADPQTGACGWSWWAAPPQGHNCGSDWLFVHEFGHQLDSLFEQSGHPEFWFNHLAPCEGNTARFGEHFDANAYILRRVPEADWQNLKSGEWRAFVDADSDAVHDPDEWLTARGYTVDPDPTTADADGDALGDFAELMASNGITIGHGERLHPALKLCDPLDSDSDDDGLPDGYDAYPMLPNLSQLSQLQGINGGKAGSAMLIRALDGLYSGEVPLFDVALLYMPDGMFDITFSMFSEWPTAAAPVESFKIMLDLDNDGWFAGTDNYVIYIDQDLGLEIWQHSADSPTEWPQMIDLTPGAHERTHVWVTQVSSGDLAIGDLDVLGVTLNSYFWPEFAGKAGEEIGFNAGIKLAGEDWHYMLGEPNTLIPLELR